MKGWGRGLLLILLCVFLWGCNVQQGQEETEVIAPLRLEMAQESYSLSDNEITWQAINETGDAYTIWLIPTLEEQQSDGSWQAIKCEVGFCGVGDPLGKMMQGGIDIQWYPTLQPGVYRLSYTVQKENSEQETISAEFVMTE